LVISNPEPRKCVPHALVNIGGTLFAGSPDQEIWQTGIRIVPVSGGGGFLTDPTGYVNLIGPLVSSWFTAHDTGLATFGVFSNAQLGYVKANNIGADGLYAGSGAVWMPSGQVNGGGTATGVLPPILTLAVTLTTAQRTGLASKGRLYIPWSITATAGFRYVSSQTAANNRVKALLSILAQNGVQGGIQPVVASILKASDTRTPVALPVTGVRTGDVIDVQRRRKNKEREAYVASPWP
jgi:hypothetical protein